MPDPSSNPPPDRERRQADDAVRDAVACERRRLADLLHQTASQSLTAAYYSSLVLARRPPADDPARAADLAALPDMIHKVIEELREITREFQEPGA